MSTVRAWFGPHRSDAAQGPATRHYGITRRPELLGSGPQEDEALVRGSASNAIRIPRTDVIQSA